MFHECSNKKNQTRIWQKLPMYLDENSSTTDDSFHTHCIVFSPKRYDAWAERIQCKLHLVLHISSLLYCTWPVLFQAVHGEISSCSLQKIGDMNLLVSPTDRNQGLESNGKGCQKLMNSLRHFPLPPGIVIHILTHNHCISMGSPWCCQLNTDIAKTMTPYGGIAVLGTVKYKSDVSCMYEAVFLVFRMTAQARFFQNSYSHQCIKTGARFSSFQLAAPSTNCQIFQESFQSKVP